MERFGIHKKEIPPDVLRAIHAADHEQLRAFAKRGGINSGIGELNKKRADERALDEALALERENSNLRDAEQHAEETRPGWDDEYTPHPHE